MKGETESFIFAAQDQSLFKRNYQANVLHNGADSKCRFCDDKIETIDHLVSGCNILAPNEYSNRHDTYTVKYVPTFQLSHPQSGKNTIHNQ